MVGGVRFLRTQSSMSCALGALYVLRAFLVFSLLPSFVSAVALVLGTVVISKKVVVCVSICAREVAVLVVAIACVVERLSSSDTTRLSLEAQSFRAISRKHALELLVHGT